MRSCSAGVEPPPASSNEIGPSTDVGATGAILYEMAAGRAAVSGGVLAETLVQITTGETAQGSIEFKSLFAVGATLFVMTLALNLLSGWVVRRFRTVY